METLRIFTAGSVDDGKSTLIGRLLYDSKSIFEEQLEAVKLASRNKGEDEINLAYLTDGLRSEREQGITIDVAYRYFSTPKRSFIIADTPGHAQYTRNMATGASTATLGIILIDANNGVVEQTRRHLFISQLLGIHNFAIAINKMDMLDFSKEIFESIVHDIGLLMNPEDSVQYIPMSAKDGDNVVIKSDRTPWYNGLPLLEYLETAEIAENDNMGFFMPVQYVIRPNQNYRGYAGQIIAGSIKRGDTIKILPSEIEATVTNITNCGTEVISAERGQSIAVEINKDIDIARGDVLCIDNHGLINIGNEITLDVVCFFDNMIREGGKYTIMHNGAETLAVIKDIERVDINTGIIEPTSELKMNDIAIVKIKTSQPIVFTDYKVNRIGGSLIFIYENNTAMAGMIKH